MTKNIFISSLVLMVFLFSCSGPVEPIKVEGSKSFYGTEISLEQALSINELTNQMKSKDSLVDVLIEGEIVETCAVKGCWMTIANQEGEDLRVRFKDYSFFVPTEGAGGKEVAFKGTAIKSSESVDMQHHYIDDADLSDEEKAIQKEAITEPKDVISFEAVGVVITGMAEIK